MRLAHGCAAIVLTAFLAFSAPVSAGGIDLSVHPGTIEIGTFFDGAVLSVTGTAPAGCDVVLRVTGAEKPMHMKAKGRALGLLWMNTGSLDFEEVPRVYRVTATRPLDQLGPGARPFTLEALEERFRITPAAADTPENRAEFLKLMISEGNYRENPAGVLLGPAEAGSEPFRAEVRLPARLSPGAYTVEAAALRDGRVVDRQERGLTVRMVGVPAMLAGMAFGEATLYGVLAIVIAILAGLAIGLVFQSKGAH